MRSSKAILFSIGIILLAYIVVLFFSGSVTMADAHRGYEAMHQFSKGGDWNSLHYPSVENSIFITYISWWAPGQWVIPSVLISCGFQSFQTVQFLLIIVSILISTYGYYRLFKKLKFSNFVNYLSILCIITNYTFYWQTLMYHGGELFLTALLPYFVYFLVKLNEYTLLKRILLFTGFAITGLFLKNTFFILLICAGIFIVLYQNKTTVKNKLSYSWPLALTFFIIVIPVYVFHLSVSETPSTAIDLEGYFNIPNSHLGDVVYSFGSPMGIFMRFSFLSHQVNKMMFGHLRFFNIFQIIPLALMLWFYVRSFKMRSEKYHALLIYFCLPFFAAFTIFYFQDKAVSYEMRHFSAIGFLFFPGFIQFVRELRYSKILVALILLICLMDVMIYSQHTKNINAKHVLWNTLKVPKEDGEILSKIEEWDDHHENGLILIEDYWQLSIGEVMNDKLVVAIDDSAVRVVSGIELDYPDYIKDINNLVSHYDHILLVGRLDSKVKPLLSHHTWTLITTAKRFKILETNLK